MKWLVWVMVVLLGQLNVFAWRILQEQRLMNSHRMIESAATQIMTQRLMMIESLLDVQTFRPVRANGCFIHEQRQE